MDGKQVPLCAIVGAPLRAAIEAQANAASASVDFIRQVSFESNGEGGADVDSGRVRKLVFFFDRPRMNGETQQVRLEVPLITLVPLPYVRIDELVADFKVSIGAPEPMLGAHSGTRSEEESDDYLSPSSRVQLVANLSSKRDSESSRSSRYAVETTMDIHLRAGRDDIPSGMNHLLAVLSEAIQVQPVAPPSVAADSSSSP
ncbi:DUF2589 domain-containing protein [Stigmatella sp. ncwal1]|uniref:DUF2589 domain-containing protein n=1 Tax=Stigmatella ashevillensis TaxID=2995309 RepID=A0ABT5DAP2_9BACT|nr:DUF2589 domain-containing protein [Stigmatella ashevillena]MDC0710180.1 DUF2589 domain-containing protein [Stigmatella ashevillena]